MYDLEKFPELKFYHSDWSNRTYFSVEDGCGSWYMKDFPRYAACKEICKFFKSLGDSIQAKKTARWARRGKGIGAFLEAMSKEIDAKMAAIRKSEEFFTCTCGGRHYGKTREMEIHCDIVEKITGERPIVITPDSIKKNSI